MVSRVQRRQGKARRLRGKALVKENKESADQKAECDWSVELKDTAQSRVLQVKHEHVAQSLVAHARNEQGNLSHSSNEDPKSDSKMICSSGNSRPAKLFTCKKRRLEYGKRAQGEQRKEDDACILNGKQFFLSGIPSNLDIWDEPGRYKEEANSCQQHNNKNKIY